MTSKMSRVVIRMTSANGKERDRVCVRSTLRVTDDLGKQVHATRFLMA
jgi:hypothetical protein